MNVEKRKKELKKEKGITLIALMITVIVLLILAGVALSLTLGERGIFKTASDAKIKTERAEIIEKAKLDIVDKQTENMGKFTENELVEILNKYGTLSDNGEETILDKTLTSTNKVHEIKVSEIWNSSLDSEKVIFTLELRSWINDEQSIIYGPFEKDKTLTWRNFIKEFTDSETKFDWSDKLEWMEAPCDCFFEYSGCLYLHGLNSATAGNIAAPILDSNGDSVVLDDIITSR